VTEQFGSDGRVDDDPAPSFSAPMEQISVLTLVLIEPHTQLLHLIALERLGLIVFPSIIRISMPGMSRKVRFYAI